MDKNWAFDYLVNYFHELFDLQHTSALDEFLDPRYHDDDIGDDNADHIQNSKEYLAELFAREPGIRVKVEEVMVRDEVITAFLTWYQLEKGVDQSLYQGVAVFVMNGNKIAHRHTFIYHKS